MKKAIIITPAFLLLGLALFYFAILIYHNMQAEEQRISELGLIERLIDLDSSVKNSLLRIFNLYNPINVSIDNFIVSFEQTLPLDYTSLISNLQDFESYINSNYDYIELNFSGFYSKIPLAIYPYAITYRQEANNQIYIIPESINFRNYSVYIEIDNNLTVFNWNTVSGNLSLNVAVKALNGIFNEAYNIDPNGNNSVNIEGDSAGDILITVKDNGKLLLTNNLGDINIRAAIILDRSNSAIHITMPEDVVKTHFQNLNVLKQATLNIAYSDSFIYDINGSLYQYLDCYIDNDGDGFRSDYTTSVYSGGSCAGQTGTPGADCAGNDAARWQNLSCYVDADNDSYTVGGIVIVCKGASCNSLTGHQAIQTQTDCVDDNAAIYPGLTIYCDYDASCGVSVDDADCGTIDCDGLDDYEQSGTESATTTETCTLHDYTDLSSNRCEGYNDCKDANTADCGSPSDSTAYTCGVCQYIDDAVCTGGTQGSCSNYATGTDCGSGNICDGDGNCIPNSGIIMFAKTSTYYNGNLGSWKGGNQKCQQEFGSGWQFEGCDISNFIYPANINYEYDSSCNSDPGAWIGVQTVGAYWNHDCNSWTSSQGCREDRCEEFDDCCSYPPDAPITTSDENYCTGTQGERSCEIARPLLCCKLEGPFLWKTTLQGGSGNNGESCDVWLSRLFDTYTNNPPPEADSDSGKCVYIVNNCHSTQSYTYASGSARPIGWAGCYGAGCAEHWCGIYGQHTSFYQKSIS